MLGIVILNYNEYKLTLDCINSIGNTYNGNPNIYIVDGGSKNNSVSIFKKEYAMNSKIKILSLDCNKGFAYANNRGVEIAIEEGCEYILISNSDVIFKMGAIEEMHKFISESKNTALVFPKVYAENGELQCTELLVRKADFIHATILSSRLRKLVPNFIQKKYYTDITKFLIPTKACIFTGCCFMVKSEEYSKIGMLDESTFLYYEENILSEKIISDSKEMYYIPTSEIVHLGGMSTNKDTNWDWCEYKISKLYYWNHYRQINKFICLTDLYLTIIIKNFLNKNVNDLNKKVKDREMVKKIKGLLSNQ